MAIILVRQIACAANLTLSYGTTNLTWNATSIVAHRHLAQLYNIDSLNDTPKWHRMWRCTLDVTVCASIVCIDCPGDKKTTRQCAACTMIACDCKQRRRECRLDFTSEVCIRWYVARCTRLWRGWHRSLCWPPYHGSHVFSLRSIVGLRACSICPRLTAHD